MELTFLGGAAEEGTETHARVRSANVQLLGGTTSEHDLDKPPS